jgi:hypothetical protein
MIVSIVGGIGGILILAVGILLLVIVYKTERND